MDGEPLEFTAFLIGGNNYFRLRDVMKLIDVFVGYDGEIRIDTTTSYIGLRNPTARQARTDCCY